MNANIKVALGLQCASENRGCYIDGPWSVYHLRHREGDPLCVAIIQDTLLDMRLGGFTTATGDNIRAYKSLEIPEGVNEPKFDIKDIKNRCYFSEGIANQYVRTGISPATY